MRILFERFVIWLFGKDVFISYSRADSSSYALSLASDLAAKDSAVSSTSGARSRAPASPVGSSVNCAVVAQWSS